MVRFKFRIRAAACGPSRVSSVINDVADQLYGSWHAYEKKKNDVIIVQG